MKMSICVLLIRVFGLNRAFRLAAWCALGLCIAWTIMVISVGAGLCRPFSYNWNRDQDGSCGNSVAAYISIAATDIGVDAVLITLPMPWLWKLQMATKTKIGLTVVFALAFLCVDSNLKESNVRRLTQTGTSSLPYSASTILSTLATPKVPISPGYHLEPLFGR